MPAFQYQALEPSGRKCKGVVEADGQRLASQLIKKKGLVPLKIVETRKNKENTDNQGLLSLAPKATLGGAHLNLFTRQLATLVAAGLPIESCLQAIGSQSEHAGTQKLVASVRSSVREGISLADSLKAYPGAFSKLYCSTVAAGEQSGHLGLVLQRLADYTEAQQEFRQKVQLALVYPVILVILCILIVVGLMVYVVPDVIEVIVTAGQDLPALTQILITTSDFIVTWGWLLGIGIVACIGAVRLFFQNKNHRLRRDQLYTRLPLIKSYSRNANSVRFGGTLAIMVNSGIPLVEAMRVSTEVVNNLFFQRQLGLALQQIEEGSSLNHALAETRLIPPMMLHLIASGEATGDLGAMLERASNAMETELQRKVETMVGLFEPATLIFMGVVVLTIVLAILMPILSMNQLIQ